MSILKMERKVTGGLLTVSSDVPSHRSGGSPLGSCEPGGSPQRNDEQQERHAHLGLHPNRRAFEVVRLKNPLPLNLCLLVSHRLKSCARAMNFSIKYSV